MRKWLSGLLVVLATSCAAEMEPGEEQRAHTIAQALPSECRWQCKPCNPGETCSELCRPQGRCTATVCNAVAICIEGYVWEEGSCSCVARCGASTCPAGQWCCNDSCGLCRDPEQLCPQYFCPTCGTVRCGAGEWCCNESCSICAPLDQGCTNQICSP